MLAKVPDKRNDGKSSFKSLQKYIEERDVIDSETGEITGPLRHRLSVETNCLDRDTAWREMLAVADMNGRVKDPVYHAVISWQKDEKPTDRQAFEACQEAMEAIGQEAFPQSLKRYRHALTPFGFTSRYRPLASLMRYSLSLAFAARQ